MRSLGYMPNEVELEVIIQRLDMDGETPCLCLLAHHYPGPEPWSGPESTLAFASWVVMIYQQFSS